MSMSETSEEKAFASLRCCMYGELGQHAADCKSVGVVESVLFPEPVESRNSRFMFIGQVHMSLREDEQVLLLFSFLRVDGDGVVNDMHIVCEFPDVFPKG